MAWTKHFNLQLKWVGKRDKKRVFTSLKDYEVKVCIPFCPLKQNKAFFGESARGAWGAGRALSTRVCEANLPLRAGWYLLILRCSLIGH